MRAAQSRTRWLGAAAIVLAGCSLGTIPGAANLSGYQRGPEDTELVLIGIHGNCDEVLPATVEELPDEVRVRVPLALDRGGCDDMALQLTATVELDDPLGGRRVVDEETGEELEVCTNPEALCEGS